MSDRHMLINYVKGEECRIAIVADGRLDEFYQERASNESHVGNIYKGRVVNVEPSIQAAFIDFGLERNGFLHISDLHPMYFSKDSKDDTEQVGLKTPRRDRPPIQRCLRRGQDILVQVLKEGIGTKGPTLTSYLSIPGRFLVMMPYMERHGVSRKVDDGDLRRQMKQTLDELNPPKDFGFIIRTAGLGRTKVELKRDLSFLQRLWRNIDRRMKTTKVGELYTESDLVIRTIRDVFSPDIKSIIVDDAIAARRARDFLAIANPRTTSDVQVYRDTIPLFHRFNVEQQIENINARTVPLPSGGSLVIDSTEALVAIDVNSGKNRESSDAEQTAFNTNMEAVDEICRQLRLRDLGGVVVNDLIDMRMIKHRKQVETRFRENLKDDRARTRILPISQFGILEMTRQRMRPSLKKSIYTTCPACDGAAMVKSPESVVLDVMRRLRVAMRAQNSTAVELTVSPDVAFQLLNRKRGALVDIERLFERQVIVRVNGGGQLDFVEIKPVDARGNALEAAGYTPPRDPFKDAAGSMVPVEQALEELDDVPEDELADLNNDVDDIADEDDEAPVKPAPQSNERAKPPAPQQNGEEEGKTEGGKRRRRRRRGGRGRRRGGRDGETGNQQDQPGNASDSADQPVYDDTDTDEQVNAETVQDGGHDGSDDEAMAAESTADVDETGDTEEAPTLDSADATAADESLATDSGDADDALDAVQSSDDLAPKRSRRRGSRGGRGRRRRGRGSDEPTDQAAADTGDGNGETGEPVASIEADEPVTNDDLPDGNLLPDAEADSTEADAPAPKPRRRRRGGRGRGTKKETGAPSETGNANVSGGYHNPTAGDE
jgi:ribonuclease E